MNNIKKSRVLIYFEFFHEQNLENLEDRIRELSRKKQFPTFRTLMVGCDYKGLRGIKADQIINTPLVNLPDDGKTE